MHKTSFITQTLIVQISVFSYILQFGAKKAAKPSCIFTAILLQCVHPNSFQGGHLYMSYVDETLERVKKQNPDQPEFTQAVYEVLESLRAVIEKNEESYRRNALLERLTTPERVVMFRR